jgi:hypothetical protein
MIQSGHAAPSGWGPRERASLLNEGPLLRQAIPTEAQSQTFFTP